MPQLTDRQLKITLAALRYIQGHLYDSPMFAASHLHNSEPIVKAKEIDEICDLINDPDFHEVNVTTLDGVTHTVSYSGIEDFIIENKGNLQTKKLEMRRKPSALPDLEPDEEHF